MKRRRKSVGINSRSTSRRHNNGRNGSSNSMMLAQLQERSRQDQHPDQDLAEERGELAVKQARITYQQGQAIHGNSSWETQGANAGPLLTPLNQANYASGHEGYEWCGMYVGHAHAKAGIRPEILKSNVFWSGYRLYAFFTKGVDVHNRKIGNFWKPHQYVQITSRSAENRKEALASFAPQAGDIVLFGAGYTHIGIVDHYDSKTGELMILEGNSGNRVRATTFEKGDRRISFIGRFNNSDYGTSVDPTLEKAKTPNIVHDDRQSNSYR